MLPDPLAILRRIVYGGMTHGQAQDLARACLVAHGVDLSPMTYRPDPTTGIAIIERTTIPVTDGETPNRNHKRRRVIITATHGALAPADDPNGAW